MQTIQRHITSSLPPEQMRPAVSTGLSHWANANGFALVGETPDSMTYSKRNFATWQILVAIFLFPIGLFALLAEKEESRATALLMVGPNGTNVAITASVNGSVARLEQEIAGLQSWAAQVAPPAAPLPPPPPAA